MNVGKSEENNLLIEKGSVASFKRGEYVIYCMNGIIWVTWPGSADVILKEGDDIFVRSSGKLCITALSEVCINIKNNKMSIGIEGFRELVLRKINGLFLSYLKKDVIRY